LAPFLHKNCVKCRGFIFRLKLFARGDILMNKHGNLN
jgi:hypothetical protein